MKGNGGSIINVTSIGSMFGFPENPAYISSKTGLSGLTRSLAYDYADLGIRVNNLVPGYFKTDMTKKLLELNEEKLLENIPIKRIGIPEDISGLTAFLSSDNASYITGQTFHVNGGMMM